MSETVAPSEPAVESLLRLAAETPPGPAWLRRVREAALAGFRESGLPTGRLEEWRQTSVAPIARSTFERGTDARRHVSLAACPLAELDAARLVWVNGRFSPELSRPGDLPAGLVAVPLSQAWDDPDLGLESTLASAIASKPHAFAALNTAAFDDGALLVVPDGLRVERPVQLMHVTVARDRAVVSHPRTLVRLGDGSELTLIETFWGDDTASYLTNAVAELFVGANSRLEHTRVQWEGSRAFHVGAVEATAARDGRYLNHNISLGSALARHDIQGRLLGQGAEITLNGLYLAFGSQHVDNHTALDHAVPHCSSHELYKGILAGTARAVFNGRILVRQRAQKTDAKQSNKNLLLSDDAIVHTRPQLEIYADDVKCTHGATIGQLEDDALFYLQARGIPRAEGRSLLIRAFAGDVLNHVGHQPLRELLEQRTVEIVSRELNGGHAS